MDNIDRGKISDNHMFPSSKHSFCRELLDNHTLA